MDEIITCTLLGVASITVNDVRSNPSGREIWTGVRVRTPDGKARFLASMAVEAEASIILDTAMDRGERVELWLTGTVDRPYPYGIRTVTENWYYGGYTDYLWGECIKTFIFALLALPMLGMGLLMLPLAFRYLASSYAYAPRHSRQAFEAGRQEDWHALRPTGSAEARVQAA